MANTRMDYDVCIIGAGIAGALVAYKLGRAGIKVIMLDAGPRHNLQDRFTYMQRHLSGDNPWQSNHPSRDVYTNGGDVEFPLNKYRVKAVGGSTLQWSGYIAIFHKSDFEMKSRYGIADDWPISYSELEPYYCEAEQELGVAGADDNPFASPRSKPYPLPPFPIGYDESKLADAFNTLGIRYHTVPQARLSKPYKNRLPCAMFSVCHACPIRAKYSADIHIELAEATGNVTVLSDANVVRIDTNSARRVKRAIYAMRDKTEHAVSAKIFVLAAHGIESPRLLLLSKSNLFPDGLANSSGMVGKYFMDHTGRLQVGQVDYSLFPYRKGFYTLTTQQFYDKPIRNHEAAFILRGRATGGHATNIAKKVVRHSGNWGSRLEREIKTTLTEEFGKEFKIESIVEPLPTETNRVELDKDVKDFFGNPAPRLIYQISDYEQTTFQRIDKLTEEIFNTMNARKLGEVKLNYEGHYSGTCRMGSDPRTSVVSKDLQTHDIENLYVVGSSVFVTLGAVNPTLSISALALRLGDHLISKRHSM